MAIYIDKELLEKPITPKCSGYAEAVAWNDTITRRDLFKFIRNFPSAVTIDNDDCKKIQELLNAEVTFTALYKSPNSGV